MGYAATVQDVQACSSEKNIDYASAQEWPRLVGWLYHAYWSLKHSLLVTSSVIYHPYQDIMEGVLYLLFGRGQPKFNFAHTECCF